MRLAVTELPVAERSLAICQTNLGPKDPRRAWTLSVTSLVYDGSGNFAEAERMAREALPILEAAYGKQCFAVASTLNRLGLALEGEGQLAEAEASLHRALGIREALMGPDSENLLPILDNLTRVYKEEGKVQEAAASRQRADVIAAHNHLGALAGVPNSVPAAMPSAPITEGPTDGAVKGGVYTSNFFQFSIRFPPAWKIFSTGEPLTPNLTGGGKTGLNGVPPENSVESKSLLFWAGAVDNQTQSPHWIMIIAFKPTSAARKFCESRSLRFEARGCGAPREGPNPAPGRWRAHRIPYFGTTGGAP